MNLLPSNSTFTFIPRVFAYLGTRMQPEGLERSSQKPALDTRWIVVHFSSVPGLHNEMHTSSSRLRHIAIAQVLLTLVRVFSTR